MRHKTIYSNSIARVLRSWHNTLLFFILLSSSFILVTSCSTTEKLPEGDVLYTGISEIAYGRKAKNKSTQTGAKDSTGVITAMAKAYNTVENLLTGNVRAEDLRALLSKNDSLSREQRDSIARCAAVLEQANEAVREEVDAALAYPPNNNVFGSSSARWPLPIGLWFYNGFAGAESRFGKWMFNSFASTPHTIATANPQLRTQVARNTLRNYGFFRGRVDYEVQPNDRNPRKAKIGYSVYPGPLFRFGTIEYQNFDAVTDSIIRATADKSLLHSGDAFNVPNLDAERQRLSTLFRNNGFFYFRPELIAYRADTLQTPFTAHLQIRPRPDLPPQVRNRYKMGETTITVMPYDDYRITDSLALREFKYRWSGDTRKPPLRFGAIRHYLFYQQGSPYRASVHEIIQQKLSGMGVFSNIQISYAPHDTTDTCSTLDVNIFGILDKPFDSELEAKITNKSNGLLGPGLAWGMSKRNAFRGAEQLSFKVHGSYEWQTGASATEGHNGLLNSFELGATAGLTYPRLRFFNLPFIRQMGRRAEATTAYKMDVDWMNRAGFFQLLNFSGRLTYTYWNLRHRRLRHELTPARLDYTMLAHRSQRFDSLMTANPALYISMRNQLVPSMAYTLTYSTLRPGTITNNNVHSRTIIISAKQAGHIVNGIYALAGHDRKERNKKLLGVPYAQFLKLSAEWRETFPVTLHSRIAARAYLGAVWSYGNSTMAPYSDLFNVGGANSIRAFGVRTLGPGRYHPATSGWSYVDQVGNLKLEANVEYRFPLVGALEGAVFLDAGNVWLMQPDEHRPGAAINASEFLNDIALGTGLGFRYDLDFLVLRFDIGVGLHAPYATGRTGYYNMPRFKDSLGFHIAVGYPF
ncbi:MAG: BamA/TamA family outer membrane protein [Bacteroidaceae bacterium]|nr:BamA/TamA family outer membrane protein [Bacteroidaceae bacterium]